MLNNLGGEDMRKAFTLVELAIVVLILGILAVTVISKFLGLYATAKDASDDAAIAAIRDAITIAHASNVIKGNNSFPTANPFTLLAQAPPYVVEPAPFVRIIPDGQRWHVYKDTSTGAFLLCCLHWNGNTSGGETGTTGRVYAYVYAPVYGADPKYKAGDLVLRRNRPH
jgi:prepilin-type N-terminal cleavage/methylation domain-containing protein